jgi:hypothetical protein
MPLPMMRMRNRVSSQPRSRFRDWLLLLLDWLMLVLLPALGLLLLPLDPLLPELFFGLLAWLPLWRRTLPFDAMHIASDGIARQAHSESRRARHSGFYHKFAARHFSKRQDEFQLAQGHSVFRIRRLEIAATGAKSASAD